MIEDFKKWFEDLGNNALKRKADITAKTGKRPKWTNTVKNKEIKEKFTEKGLSIKGIHPRSSSDKKAKEWLYDLIWREFDDENNFIGVMLAMEIELSDMNKKGLIYDFNKILQSDSNYKVFVCQQKTLSETNNIIAILNNAAMKYKTKVEAELLIACWCWDSESFIFDNSKLLP